MKIYSKIVFGPDGEIIEEQSFDYKGPLALCKGTTTSNTSVDPAYNRGLLTIQGAQQDIANKYFQAWERNQQPLEAAQAQANLNMVPLQEQLQTTQLQYQNQLAPLEGQLAVTEGEQSLALQDDKFALAQQHLGASADMLSTANVNLDDRAAQATADVSNQFGIARKNLDRVASPFRSGQAQGSLIQQEALAKAGAATSARRQGELDKVQMLGSALQNSTITLGGGQ